MRIYEVGIIGGPQKGEKIQTDIRETIDGKEYGCRCEDIELAKEAVKNHERLKVKKMRDVFDRHSLINKQLQKATFENYEPSNESQTKAKRIAARYVEVFDLKEPRNLLFSGGYGIGKSHLSKAITDGVIEEGHSAVFISVPKLLTKLRTTYNKDSEFSEGDLIEALNGTRLLVLDDLGAEKSSEWAFEKLFEIIDSRQGMHTIYTSNFSPEDLIDKLGERNFSRVVNRDTTIVEIKGDNHRLDNFA